jgi:PAS domain S-box-containing protein
MEKSTETHQTIRTLKDSPFRRLVAESADGILVVNAEGRILFTNPAAAFLLGHNEGALLGALFGYPIVKNEATELDVRRPDGSRAVAEMRVVQIEWEGEKAFLASLRDITERKRAERAVRESESRLTRMLETMVDGMVEVDLQGRITFANPAAERILELRWDHIVGRYYQEREWGQIDEHGAPFPADRLPLAVALRDQRAVHGLEHGLALPNGKRKWLSVSAAPLHDADGRLQGAVANFRDITERRRAAEQLAQYVADLERSNRDLEEFAHVVSHDLREPLRTMRSYVQLIAKRLGKREDDELYLFIGFVIDATKRMQELIQGLLEYSRAGTRKQVLRAVDTQEVLAKALSNLHARIREVDATVTHDSLPVVMGDEVQLVQIFQNLIENGIKFQDKRAPQVHVSAEEEGEYWAFTVQDNGIGIAPEDREHLFEIFQRLHSRDEYEGTGIGLAICKRIIERHGGRLWVDTNPQGGSEFKFTLPKS